MKYLLWALIIFLIEVYIALYIDDSFIRPYVGDFLVVVLIYLLLRSFWKTSAIKVALSVLLFSFGVEIAQYFHIVDLIGLGKFKVARIIIGTTFQWLDLVAYTLGIMAVYIVDTLFLESHGSV